MTERSASDAPHSGAQNPLLLEWTTPFGLAPFDVIQDEHFLPAFEGAMDENDREIAAIADNAEAPSFANTIEAMELSGDAMTKVAGTFFNLTGAHTSDALRAIEREISPRLARHHSAIMLNSALYARIRTLLDARNVLKLTPEQDRLLERYGKRFKRAGAELDEAGKARMSEIVERLATLGTQFAQNVLADENGFKLELNGEDDLAGLPDFLRASAAATAREMGSNASHVITLSRSSIEPFLTFSSRRDLREQAFAAWIARGSMGGPTDNRAIITETIALRAERAKLLGYDCFADYKLDDTMATTPEAVRELLTRVWQPAILRASEERNRLQACISQEGGNFNLAASDWRYYAEKVRKQLHDIDESELKPYFQLDRMIGAAFETAHQLFGLSFEEQKDLKLYHPDVRAWTVADAKGRHVGLFLGDYFARPSKRSGAWMSAFRSQERLAGDIRPIIVNVMNFNKAAAGEPSLLSFDDARTLFHEFGHALHGLLSNVVYPSLAGTSVARDFVELPSQLYEHWLATPQILRRFAIHHRTGKAIPEALLERLLAAGHFNQGFATLEYLSSAMVDLELHLLAQEQLADFNPDKFEADVLAKLGMPAEIVMRHRSPHFLHVFSSDGYSAGYYSYMWSEVMDADAFSAFEETGNVFDAETAGRLYEHIYSAGNRADPAKAYVAFRGRLPAVDALIEKRGLTRAA